ncbi:FkbM family methyltransferase [Paenibacillus crassostreae]|uniref:Methyltransferase FkbM domain-containing protein n=1 Tax=Paenibacillus crassostreae TaxID=1763538 RepID=A0A167D8R0_9BACL|nr:FkbM family methyltransferase [Paenibacillus crassostreae]AOZ93253.1 hypothetical protein LPB68_14230 [Paenibacillus crassostreae]OAB74076.1 hypothetical protein PNBC_13070 [Paenibacillus crassostreae]
MVEGTLQELLTREQNPLELLLKKSSIILKDKDKKIVLFGAGNVGKFYLQWFRKYGLDDRLYFCDNNPQKWGEIYNNIPIISPNELKEGISESYIIITSLDYGDDIFLQLTNNGLGGNLVDSLAHKLIKDLFSFSNYEDYYNVIKDNLSGFEEVFRSLSDSLSKEVFMERLNYCITMDPKYLIHLKSDSPQYFESGIISLSKNEVFIDGGAFIGDTAEEFIKQTKGEFIKIYSFEPEETKHKEFLTRTSNSSNVELVPYGLWSCKDELQFEAKDSTDSGLSEFGNVKVPVISIDEFLDGKPTTFIKMDIEGSEYEALLGAEMTIKKFKPKLAICVYHNLLDVIEIPKYLKKIVPEYKLYFRHYGNDGTETICYAVVD